MPVWRSWPSERPLPVKVPPLPSRRGASPWPGRGAFRRGRGRPGGSGNRSERAFTTPHRTILPADMGLRPRRATIHQGHVALVGPAPAGFQPRERTSHARYRPAGRRGSPPGPDRENRCARANPPPPFRPSSRPPKGAERRAHPARRRGLRCGLGLRRPGALSGQGQARLQQSVRRWPQLPPGPKDRRHS